MPQKTLVLKVPAGEQEGLRRRLAGGSFDFRSIPHALFSARGEGVTATLYRSGKLVVQGPEPELFAARYLDPAIRPAGEGRAHPPAAPRGPAAGSDEAGKGDYFGPLVVAAVRLDEELLEELATSPHVRDSKKLSDEAARRTGAALRARCPHAVERLDPPEYNREYARVGNLNLLLAEQHARALRGIARAGLHVIVDQFGPEGLMRRALQGLDVRLEQRPRAESHPAVAAASILAREAFLDGIEELSREYAVDLHKGAGSPTEASARRFLALHGPDELGAVAKLHFKTTRKLLGEGR